MLTKMRISGSRIARGQAENSGSRAHRHSERSNRQRRLQRGRGSEQVYVAEDGQRSPRRQGLEKQRPARHDLLQARYLRIQVVRTAD